MLLKYTTGKLPPNFFMLGIILLLIGIIAIVMSEPAGTAAILASIPLLFMRSGLLFDTEKKQLKKYTGLFTLRLGKWIDISSAKHLQIIRVQQIQSMGVLSISRTESNLVYKLILELPNEKIELLLGNNEFVTNIATAISKQLELKIKTTPNIHV